LPGRRLNFVSKYREKILSGSKRSTVRLSTDLKVGDLVELVVGGERLGKARVVKLEWKRVSELSDADAAADGFRDRQQLLRALREHYGPLEGSRRVVVITFELL
jgi:hypothetical protein